MPRGFKQCTKCKAFVGPRKKVCDCGHAFAFKSDAVAAPAAPASGFDRVVNGVQIHRPPPAPRTLAEIEAKHGDKKGHGEDGGIVLPDKPQKRAPKKKGAPPKVKDGLANLSEPPVSIVGVTDRKALASFIKQLKACSAHSDYHGGCYSAFLHHRNGTLRVEIMLTHAPKTPKKK